MHASSTSTAIRRTAKGKLAPMHTVTGNKVKIESTAPGSKFEDDAFSKTARLGSQSAKEKVIHAINAVAS